MLAPCVVEFIGECAAFPAGAHDDQVDAWSQGAKRLLRIKAKPPAPDPRLNYPSIGTALIFVIRHGHLGKRRRFRLAASIEDSTVFRSGASRVDQPQPRRPSFASN